MVEMKDNCPYTEHPSERVYKEISQGFSDR